MLVLEKVIHGMKTPVSYLNITRITDFRKDGHPSIYRRQHVPAEEQKAPLKFQDCSHWCLPGVPDTWNEILYAQLLVKDYERRHKQKT
uniref:Trichome birefringence-like C-terminal domain-containing protein n=1 Tax=Kalanchoe fedtschenkoi TaxID=63787 RepID=A0A7N1A518_KALFE